VAHKCEVEEYVTYSYLTPDMVPRVNVFIAGHYEPSNDHDSETSLMNINSQSVRFALKDFWDLESRINSNNFRPEWVSQVSSRLAWVDKLPLALPVWQGSGSPGVDRQFTTLAGGAKCAKELQTVWKSNFGRLTPSTRCCRPP
jgi:hypothetical protein